MMSAAAPHITSCKLLLFFYCTDVIYTRGSDIRDFLWEIFG